jgi:hypothetical protein
MKLLYSVIAIIGAVGAIYRQKIDAFSFDINYGEYPVAYKQFGASIGLKSKLKLIPAAK